MSALIKNNIRLLLARKGSLFMLLILPILMVSAGLMQAGDGRSELRLGLIDQDQSVLSQALVADLEQLRHSAKALTESEWEESLISGQVDSVLRIAPGFETTILQTQSPNVELISLKGQEVVGFTQTQINGFIGSLLTIATVEQPITAQALINRLKQMQTEGVQFEVDRSSRHINRGLAAGGAFLLFILSMNMLSIGRLILKEKAWSTRDRIQQAPVSRTAYLGANVATGIIFLGVNLISIYLLTRYGFDIHTTWEMYLVWFVYGLVWIALGIWLALSVPSNQVHAIAQPIITTAAAMLGGSFWPLYIMPEFMQKLAAITPHYWANQWLEALQKGNGFAQYPQYLLALIGFLLLFLALASFNLRRKKQAQAFV